MPKLYIHPIIHTLGILNDPYSLICKYFEWCALCLLSYKAAPDTKLGLLSRGCKCKRNKCLKKYCECFRATILCSDNCKCINCKNVSETFQPFVFDWGLNNRKLYQGLDDSKDNMILSNETNAIVLEGNNNINAALGIISANRDNVGFNSHNTAGFMNYAPGFSAHSSPQVYQRRRFPELLEAKRICTFRFYIHILIFSLSGIAVEFLSSFV